MSLQWLDWGVGSYLVVPFITTWQYCLTHSGRVTHICVIIKLTIIGSDYGIFLLRCQAIIWIKDGILLIGPLGTNFSIILIKIYIFSFKKMHLKISSGKWRPSCLGLNSWLTQCGLVTPYIVTSIRDNIGSGKGLLPEGTKPFPQVQPMLTLLLVRSSGIHLRVISQETPQLVTEISLKIT